MTSLTLRAIRLVPVPVQGQKRRAGGGTRPTCERQRGRLQEGRPARVDSVDAPESAVLSEGTGVRDSTEPLEQAGRGPWLPRAGAEEVGRAPGG